MAANALPDTLSIGKGVTMTFVRDGKWLTRNHLSGGPDDDMILVPPHWHETHDEIFHVVKGKVDVMIGSTWKTYTPEDGEVRIPKGIVHSIRSIKGIEVIFEERTDPMDNEKEMFFRNLFASGKMTTNLFDAMQVFYYGDGRPALPGHVKWIERAFVTIFGGYLAPLLGYKVAFKPDTKRT